MPTSFHGKLLRPRVLTKRQAHQLRSEKIHIAAAKGIFSTPKIFNLTNLRKRHRRRKPSMGIQRQLKKITPSRGCASDQFPGRLHDLMTYTEQQGLSDIISWVQNGQAIMVHDSERLLQILPHFGFSQSKYRSFQRQL